MSTRQPRYMQIASQLRADIDQGVYVTGKSVPTEAELSARFEVAPGTVREALKVLVAEGTLSTRRGAKKIVMRTPSPSPEFNEFRSFAQWAYGQNKQPGGRVVEQHWEAASAMDARLLHVHEGSSVLVVLRVRFIDGEPVMVERTRYPEVVGRCVEQLAPAIPSVTNELAQRFDVHFAAADHLFSVGLSSPEDAELLEQEQGVPVLKHFRVSRDRFGTPLERSEDRYLGGIVALAVSNTQANNSLSWTQDVERGWA